MNFAQTSDDIYLSKAAYNFNNGSFSEVLSLTGQISDTAKQSIRFQKFRLQALSYLSLSQNDKAIDAVKKMLELNPTYQFNPITDPDELKVLLNKLRIIPKLNLGLSLSVGSNTTYVKPIGIFTLAQNDKTYSSRNTMIFSLDGGYNLNNRSGIGISLIHAVKEYSLQFGVNDWKSNLTERLSYIDVPIYYKYKVFEANNISFQAHLGAYLGYLYRANNQINSVNDKDNLLLEIRSFDAIKRKSAWNFGVIYGAALQYNRPKGSIVLNCTYFNGANNIVNTENRYSNPQLMHEFYYIDDDLRLNNLSIGLGYIININYQIERRNSKW